MSKSSRDKGALSSVLALDPSLQTGWALWNTAGGKSGVVDLRPRLCLGEAVWRFQHWLASQITTHRVSELFIERPYINTKSENAMLPGYLVAAAHAVAYGHDVPRDEVSAKTWRKKLFGEGNMKRAEAKAKAVRFAQMAGWSPADDNEAEAICILTYFKQQRALTTREMDEVP